MNILEEQTYSLSKTVPVESPWGSGEGVYLHPGYSFRRQLCTFTKTSSILISFAVGREFYLFILCHMRSCTSYFSKASLPQYGYFIVTICIF